MAETAYDGGSIRVLEGLEAVRKRPGMYIGTTGKAGLHHLAYEVLDNSVDEAANGHASAITLTLHPDGSASVADDGRGIPVDIHPVEKRPTVEVVFTTLHAGGKFDGGSYAFSGGLHGVGSSVVNALSAWTRVEVVREGQRHSITFGHPMVKGKQVFGGVTSPLRSSGRCPKGESGTTVTFLPDEEVFTHSGFDAELLAARLRHAAFINPGLTLTLVDARGEGEAEVTAFCYVNGLSDFMAEQGAARLAAAGHEGEVELLSPPTPIRLGGKDAASGGEWDLAMQWYPDGSYAVSSFANGIETGFGGAHVKGHEQVLTGVVNRYARQDHVALLGEKDPNLEAADIRRGLGLIISVKVREPQFVGQTKDQLSNEETRLMVRTGFAEAFTDWMNEHPTEARVFIARCAEEMRTRLKLAALAESERAKSEKRGLAARGQPLPHKLSDCSTKDRSTAELFIVEGDSAAGPAIKSRSAAFQAVLPIRGKGLNIERALAGRDPADKIGGNKEVQDLIATIGAGSQDLFDVSAMRYGKIVILTDADDDGKHIELLLLTLFYRLMPDLVRQGHLYVARPPLFSVTTSKGDKVYLPDQAALERWEASNKFDKSVLRFKGLGEMNANQLGETALNPITRTMARIVIEDDSIADAALVALMGSDSSAKWDVLSAVEVDEKSS